MTTTLTYHCEGDVRGSCGHRHTTRSGALRCLRSDQAACERQGGYSDREICDSTGEVYVVVDDGAITGPVVVSHAEYSEEV